MGMLTRAVAVLGLVLASAVAIVATGSPASASVPCTQSFFGSGTQQSITVYVPPNGTWLTPGARVTDVDVRVQGQSYESLVGPLTITVSHERRAEIYQSRYQDTGYYPYWNLTFDDEAGSRPTSGQTEGRVLPTFPLSIHDLSPASGIWRVDFDQTSGDFRPQGVELIITSDDCDSDGDGVPQYADNCPTVANADQTDWDGDRIGNLCDGTPGTAPAPPTSPTRFVGTVDSVAAGCKSGVDVTIWRTRSGDDRKLVVVTTRATGKFRTKAPRKAGRYYATVGSPTQPLCGDASSRVVRIKRR
jgi:hypothetical protein